MGFYKNTGGVEEYNSKDIENVYIPAGKPFLFTYTKRCIGSKKISTILVPCTVGNEEDCGQCVFRSIAEVEECPLCTYDERKDGKNIIFLAHQML